MSTARIPMASSYVLAICRVGICWQWPCSNAIAATVATQDRHVVHSTIDQWIQPGQMDSNLSACTLVFGTHLCYLNLHVHLYISISPCLSPFYLQLSSSLSAFSSVSFRFFSLFPSFFPLSCLFFSFSNYHCICLSALICVGMPPGTPSKNTITSWHIHAFTPYPTCPPKKENLRTCVSPGVVAAANSARINTHSLMGGGEGCIVDVKAGLALAARIETQFFANINWIPIQKKRNWRKWNKFCCLYCDVLVVCQGSCQVYPLESLRTGAK